MESEHRERAQSVPRRNFTVCESMIGVRVEGGRPITRMKLQESLYYGSQEEEVVTRHSKARY